MIKARPLIGFRISSYLRLYQYQWHSGEPQARNVFGFWPGAKMFYHFRSRNTHLPCSGDRGRQFGGKCCWSLESSHSRGVGIILRGPTSSKVWAPICEGRPTSFSVAILILLYLFLDHFINSINIAFSDGFLCPSQREGIITLLCKNKDHLCNSSSNPPYGEMTFYTAPR